MGCLMFTEAAQLYGCEYGKVPFDVVSNLAFEATGLPEYTEPEGQGLYLWALARPGM